MMKVSQKREIGNKKFIKINGNLMSIKTSNNHNVRLFKCRRILLDISLLSAIN